MTVDLNVLDRGAYEDVLRPIWQFLALSDAPTDSDAIFVFGGIDLAVPHHAANLYLDQYASKLLVSGAAGALTTDMFAAPENEVFSHYMQRMGVPAADIILEPTAGNTGENVRFGMKALIAAGIRPQRLLLVAKPFLMRRCVATFALIHPEVEVVPSPPSGSMMRFVDRPRTGFAERLLAELERLDQYAAAGFIKPQDIPPRVRRLALGLRDGA